MKHACTGVCGLWVSEDLVPGCSVQGREEYLLYIALQQKPAFMCLSQIILLKCHYGFLILNTDYLLALV